MSQATLPVIVTVPMTHQAPLLPQSITTVHTDTNTVTVGNTAATTATPATATTATNTTTSKKPGSIVSDQSKVIDQLLEAVSKAEESIADLSQKQIKLTNENQILLHDKEQLVQECLLKARLYEETAQALDQTRAERDSLRIENNKLVSDNLRLNKELELANAERARLQAELDGPSLRSSGGITIDPSQKEQAQQYMRANNIDLAEIETRASQST